MSEEREDIFLAMLFSGATFFFLLSIMIIIIYKYMIKSQKQKELLFKSILNAQEEERKRIGRDIHDGIGGLLSGAKIQLGSIVFGNLSNLEMQNISKVVYGYITRANIEVRTATYALTPDSIALSGIKGAIDQLCDDFKLHFEVELINNFPEGINKQYEIQIYRIIQELFNNALKHSNAENVILSINTTQSANLEIKFQDNGIGFEYDSNEILGSGLINIKNRIIYLGGDLKFSNLNGSNIFINFNLNKLT
jgi:signal transduction histidine kinase